MVTPLQLCYGLQLHKKTQNSQNLMNLYVTSGHKHPELFILNPYHHTLDLVPYSFSQSVNGYKYWSLPFFLLFF